jgi:hypothetical protein
MLNDSNTLRSSRAIILAHSLEPSRMTRGQALRIFQFFPGQQPQLKSPACSISRAYCSRAALSPQQVPYHRMPDAVKMNSNLDDDVLSQGGLPRELRMKPLQNTKTGLARLPCFASMPILPDPNCRRGLFYNPIPFIHVPMHENQIGLPDGPVLNRRSEIDGQRHSWQKDNPAGLLSIR